MRLVEVDEQDQRCPRRSLVLVRQGMVPRQPADEDRRLVVEVGVELDVTEPGLGSVQRRVGRVGPCSLDEGVDIDAGDLFGEPQILRQRDVADHWARRSSSSRSRSSNRLARRVNSSS
jgi:hypothetical protein